MALILVDPSRFKQALGNLVSNAIKYGPANALVQLWMECHEQSISIYVADQGPSIPVNKQDRLFTQFGKLSLRPMGGEHNTGRGVWIVKHLFAAQ
jgi:signal transduction histidine kinase